MSDRRDRIAARVAAMTPGERVTLYHRLADRKRQQLADPLAFGECWQGAVRSAIVAELMGSPEATSQRASAGFLMRMTVWIALLLGGNRSGKTEFGAQWAIAQAQGLDHPATQAWIRRNGWDPDDVAIPNGPGVVWAGSVSFGDAREYVRPKLDKYLPKGTIKRNWGADKQAEVILPGGGRIVSKAYAQGRKAWQGAGIRGVWCDEEPEDEDLIEEAMMRLVDDGGRILLTMTPLLGLTWPYHRWVVPWERGDLAEGQWVEEIHGLDNPHVDRDFLVRKLRAMDPQTRAQRGQGRFQAAAGLIYPMWSVAIHVVGVEWDHPPIGWAIFRAIDFGARNPFCVLWAAENPDTGQLIIYREHYRAEWTLRQHAEEIHSLERCDECEGTGAAPDGDGCEACDERGRERITVTWADPEDRQARIDLAREHGVSSMPAKKAVRNGITTVQDYLLPAPIPGLVVKAGACPNFAREIRSYQWAKHKSSATAQPDKPRKIDDHAMDTIRYLVVGHQRYRHGVGVA